MNKKSNTIFDGQVWMNDLQYGIVLEDPAVTRIEVVAVPATPPVVAPPSMTDRIDQLTGQKYALQSRAEVAENALEKANRELAELRAAKVAPPVVKDPAEKTTPGTADTRTKEEIDAEIVTRATNLARNESFIGKCNEIADAGVAVHEDFQAVMGGFAPLGNIPPVVIEALLETSDAPHEVLYALGKDLTEAARIFKLATNPVKLAVELKKKADGIVSASRTKADEPIPGVVGRTRVAVVGDPSDPAAAPQMSSKDWHAAREKQVAERNARQRA